MLSCSEFTLVVPARADDWGEWVCPHILGGLPPAVVEKEFVITRGADGRAFVAIVGVTEADADERAPKALKGGP